MAFQPGANLYTQSAGLRPENVEVPAIMSRAPASTDTKYPIGKRWVDRANNAEYCLTSQTSVGNVLSSTWTQLSNSGGAGSFTSLTVTPGPVSLLGTVGINTSGSGVTTIGTGGTGATNIGNATGNTAVTGSLTASTGLVATTGGVTATAGNIVASAGNITATAGSITAGTTITATLGNITATNGNIVRGTAGNKDVYSSVASTTTAGANSAGTVTLTGGTATVNTTAVTASSIIRIYRQGIGATGAAALGILTIDNIVAATSFDIRAVQAADATALQATDVSVIAWEIVN